VGVCVLRVVSEGRSRRIGGCLEPHPIAALSGPGHGKARGARKAGELKKEAAPLGAADGKAWREFSRNQRFVGRIGGGSGRVVSSSGARGGSSIGSRGMAKTRLLFPARS
jgi:hypothetical protein